jgi:hypothetical protein
VTPVFASEEEALAAAGELYGRYLAISNEIGQGGWKDTSQLRSVARDRALNDDTSTAEGFQANGWTQVGESTFDSLILQQLEDAGAGAVDLVVYLCIDVSKVDVLDSHGQSVITSSRPERQPLEVEIDDVEGDLKVSRSEVWSGQDFC